MHHCVGTYGDRVRHGGSYVYSVRKQATRVATIELSKCGERASLGHIRGPCNSQVPKEIERAVLKWLRSQKEFRFPEPPEDPFQRHLGIEFVGHGRGAAVVDDPEIPF